MAFDDRVASGELRVEVIWSRRVHDDIEELRGFESQVVQYVDRLTGDPLAECHRYILIRGPRAGELGGSGRPDPKWLLVGEEEWNISHRDDERPCADCAIWRPRALASK